jgi:hypothetical protein
VCCRLKHCDFHAIQVVHFNRIIHFFTLHFVVTLKKYEIVELNVATSEYHEKLRY